MHKIEIGNSELGEQSQLWAKEDRDVNESTNKVVSSRDEEAPNQYDWLDHRSQYSVAYNKSKGTGEKVNKVGIIHTHDHENSLYNQTVAKTAVTSATDKVPHRSYLRNYLGIGENTELWGRTDRPAETTSDLFGDVDLLINQLSDNNRNINKKEIFKKLEKKPRENFSIKNINKLISVGKDGLEWEKEKIAKILNNLTKEKSDDRSDIDANVDWDELIYISNNFFTEFENYFQKISSETSDVESLKKKLYLTRIEKEL